MSALLDSLCGPKKHGLFKDITGKRFGRLVAVECVGRYRHTSAHLWRCKCDCGNFVDVPVHRLNGDKTKSCGCWRKEKHRTHGMRFSSTSVVWRAMKDRCFNPANTNYARYGGRGIGVCERWLAFENFFADMGERPPGKTLDRYPNNDGNYEPGNCRWATPYEQRLNASNVTFVTINGKTQCVAHWCDELEINAGSVYSRIHRGSTPEDAIQAAIDMRSTT